MATVSEYGTWRSPITSELATESAVSFQELHVDRAPGREDVVYWTELRYDEDGRYVVCSLKQGDDSPTSWTPKNNSSRTRVHEYGGGAFCVHDATVYFTNDADQRLYEQKSCDAPARALSAQDAACRLADGEFHPKYGLIYAVCEDHSQVEAKEAENYVVAFDPGNKEQHVITRGCDFYSSPRVSPDGKQIAWVQWNHPNMPWDTTEIWTAELNGTGSGIVKGTARKVAGGDDTSVLMPRWTPDNQLLYIGDQSDWWNIYLTAAGGHSNLHPVENTLTFTLSARRSGDRSGSSLIIDTTWIPPEAETL